MSVQQTIRIEAHTLTTRDQAKIAATLYRPNEPKPVVILIASAMGFRQTFYRHYAQYLAEQGFATLTFDYRGIGQSLQGSLWNYEANLLQWGSQDLQAALAWLGRHYPQHKIYVVGHSIGALILGLATDNAQVQGLIGIAAAHLYWRNWPIKSQLKLFLFWYGILPFSTMAVGYFPAKLFGLGEAQPRGIARDWGRSGRSKQGVEGIYRCSDHHQYETFTGHAIFYSFDDDTVAPGVAIDPVLTHYPNAQNPTRRHVIPQEEGLSTIGHHGFFREPARDTLWKESVEWIQSHNDKV